MKDFEDEERALRDQPERLVHEKIKDQEKRDKEEQKKIEKVIKKEVGEVEELYHNVSSGNAA